MAQMSVSRGEAARYAGVGGSRRGADRPRESANVKAQSQALRAWERGTYERVARGCHSRLCRCGSTRRVHHLILVVHLLLLVISPPSDPRDLSTI
jgi:hypothetical protein